MSCPGIHVTGVLLGEDLIAPQQHPGVRVRSAKDFRYLHPGTIGQRDGQVVKAVKTSRDERAGAGRRCSSDDRDWEKPIHLEKGLPQVARVLPVLDSDGSWGSFCHGVLCGEGATPMAISMRRPY